MTASPTAPKPYARRLKVAGVAFFPVRALRKRHDGWTPARQRDFLAALYACGVVATAARTVNMSVKSAYRLRARPGAESFAAAWDRLLRYARERAYDMAIGAALTENFVPRTYRGLFVGSATANNNRILLAAMRAADAARRRVDVPFDVLLDALYPSGKGHE